MGGIPKNMQLVKTQKLLLFGPFYNNIKTTSPQAQRETKWKNFTGKPTEVIKNYLKPVRC
jgi:hypothetical protein